MSILRLCLFVLLGLTVTASGQEGPTPAALAAARAYGLPTPPGGGSVTGPFELDVPNVLVYLDASRLRLTMLFTNSHSVLLADIGADGTTVTPRFAFNPYGYYVVNGSTLSAPMYQPPPGLDEQWPMVVPIYQVVSRVAAELPAGGAGSGDLDALLNEIISGGNQARSDIISGGFAECIEHYENGIYQGCW